MAQQLALPAYEQLLKAGHTFNLLDARGAISVTERAAYIGRIRHLARAVAQSYLDSRARLGFPMAPRGLGRRDARRARQEPGEEGRVMHSTKSLLVELFVEELPPKALKKLGEVVRADAGASLKAQGLTGEHAASTPYATPRRLAAHVSAVQAQAADRSGHAQADAGRRWRSMPRAGRRRHC